MLRLVTFGISSLFLVTPISSTSALRTCGTTDPSGPIVFSEQEIAYKSFRQNGSVGALAAAPNFAPVAPIKVYYHGIAIDKTRRSGWLSEIDISVQVQLLNFSFNSSGLSFVLANISRDINEGWYNNGFDNVEMTSSRRVGKANDLNLFTVGCSGSVIGTGSFPSDYAKSPQTDAVVVCHETTPNGNSESFNQAKTAIHEIGHWVGLLHTFQGGCSDGVGDGVDDTPPEKERAIGCPHGRDTCIGGGPDPIHNFMDYSDDSCLNEFTPGQVVRLRGQLAMYRGIPA